jgi:ELWxxDGT repeat protein
MAPVLLAGLAMLAGCGVQPEMDDSPSPSATTPQRLEPTPWMQDLDTRPVLFPTPYEGSVTLSTGITLFAARDELHGMELWASDGTEAGTRLVKELGPGLTGGILGSTEVQGTLYFATWDEFGIGGSTLWKTDGTAAGTVRVKHFPRGDNLDYHTIYTLTQFKGTVYFIYGGQLWTSDGTEAGTTFFHQVVPEDGYDRPELYPTQELLFFQVSTPTYGMQLWRTDGTATGKVLLKEFAPWQGPRAVTPMGGAVYFIAGPNRRQLWKSDGTAAGTILVTDLMSDISHLSAVGSTLFIVREGALWKSDGTQAGTVEVRNFDSESSSSTWLWNLTSLNGVVYFTVGNPESGEQQWRSDGTSTGTFQVLVPWAGPDSSSLHQLLVWKNHLYVLALADAQTLGLWKSDGTAANTTLLQTWPAPPPGSCGDSCNPSSFHSFGNVLLAVPANQEGKTWRTDGTVAGTRQLGSVRTGSTRGSQSRQQPFAVIDQKVFFSTRDSPCTETLWRTDGTSPGTLPLTALRTSCDSERAPPPARGVRVGSTLLFVAQNSSHGAELWRSDGTPAGTFLVKDILPGSSSSLPGSLTEVNGRLFFYADDGMNGRELWKSDGTAAGTVLVKDIFPGGNGSSGTIPGYSSYGGKLTAVGGLLYFTAEDGTHGEELWKSDGTAAGTVLLKDIFPGPYGSSVSTPIALNGRAFFSADDGIHGEELWKSDGTAAGTVLVKDIVPGTQGSHADTEAALGVDGQLYFTARDELHGWELWKSDGTGAGTVLVKDLNPGAGDSWIAGFTPVSNGLVFAAYQDAHGFELWRTDGTGAGTARLTDLLPGSFSGVRFWPGDPYGDLGSHDYHDPRLIETLALEEKGLVLFNGVDEAGGAEPWVTDGTPAGTTRVADLVPGPESSEPMSFARLGSDRVFFFAAHATLGREPHVLSLSHLASALDNLGSALGSSLAQGNTCGRSNKASPVCGASNAPDHLYRWTAPYSGTFTFTTLGSSYDTVLQLVDPSTGASLGCNDDAPGSRHSTVSVSLTAGQQVRLSVDGYGSSCGAFTLNIHGVSATKRGLTWVQSVSDSCGQTRVICNDCDPYQGDTLCSDSRPLLCIKKDSSLDCSAPNSSDDGWSASTVKLTSFLVRGTQLYSLAEADALCARTFGTGYRMAEHHDGGGGWGWRAKGTISPLSTPSSTHPRDGRSNLPNRFWVRIKNQRGNCWD